jgi:hypothetical protein
MNKLPILHPNLDSSIINARNVAISIILYKEELGRWIIEHNQNKVSLELFIQKRQQVEEVVSNLFDVAKEYKFDRTVLRHLVLDYEGFVDLGWISKEDICLDKMS